MAVTYGTPTRIKLSPQNWLTITDVTLDSSYATGGESITANGLGLDTITGIMGIGCDDGWQLEFNASTTKIQAFASIVGLTESIVASAMTDGGSTSGHKDFANTIPAGSHILGWRAVVSTAFTGDTSATIMVGVSGDTDRFSADTSQSVFATGTVGSASLAADALDTMATAITPRVTITSATDFTNVAAGGTAAVTISYRSSSGGLIECAPATDMSAVVGKVFALGK